MLEVLNGAPVTEVAVPYGVSRQSVYTWKAKHTAGGFAALKELSRRPRSSPTRLSAEVEALACEMRRAHPRWGARRTAHELARAGVSSAPSRATAHRMLVRNGLVRRQEQQHRRKYKRWQREARCICGSSTWSAGSSWPTAGSARCSPVSTTIPGSWWLPRSWPCPRGGPSRMPS
ncbi:helix-turn-helix domain-containing protein [Streptomyces syringium]|uniref:helix-turn-helix domain-containing protein n=1 Tax=Streptomyces syringium TaxID=76729 RepID=UPI003456BFC0